MVVSCCCGCCSGNGNGGIFVFQSLQVGRGVVYITRLKETLGKRRRSGSSAIVVVVIVVVDAVVIVFHNEQWACLSIYAMYNSRKLKWWRKETMELHKV
jgi:hypothetical protein